MDSSSLDDLPSGTFHIPKSKITAEKHPYDITEEIRKELQVVMKIMLKIKLSYVL